jgi:hypothetical protein
MSFGPHRAPCRRPRFLPTDASLARAPSSTVRPQTLVTAGHMHTHGLRPRCFLATLRGNRSDTILQYTISNVRAEPCGKSVCVCVCVCVCASICTHIIRYVSHEMHGAMLPVRMHEIWATVWRQASHRHRLNLVRHQLCLEILRSHKARSFCFSVQAVVNLLYLHAENSQVTALIDTCMAAAFIGILCRQCELDSLLLSCATM